MTPDQIILSDRILQVGPERGSADTVRDFRGFAIKLKTKEGNNDWVFNNQVSMTSKCVIMGPPLMII